MKSTQMIIGEAVSDVAVKEIVNLMREHVRDAPGVHGHSILVEEGGLMVVLITDWRNRQDCVAYHASRTYRQLVAATQHLLVGSYVVKLFQNRNDKFFSGKTGRRAGRYPPGHDHGRGDRDRATSWGFFVRYT